MKKVDVMLLRVPGEREDWFQETLASLEDSPVNVHVLPGTPGHIGKGRLESVSAGTAPYFAFIDPDDRVMPQAIQRCADALDVHPEAVAAYTMEAPISLTGKRYPGLPQQYYEECVGKPCEIFTAHGLVVYRRDALPDDLNFLNGAPYCADFLFKQRLWDANFIFLPLVGYEHRHHSSGKKFDMASLDEPCKQLLAERNDVVKQIRHTITARRVSGNGNAL